MITSTSNLINSTACAQILRLTSAFWEEAPSLYKSSDICGARIYMNSGDTFRGGYSAIRLDCRRFRSAICSISGLST